MTRTICPQMAGFYKSNNDICKYVLLPKSNPNSEYYSVDAFPCDGNLIILNGFESPIPFLAQDFGDMYEQI